MEVEIGNPDTMSEQPPKRGPGRPRKDGSPAQPRRPRKSTAEAKQQAMATCAAAVAVAQMGVLWVAHTSGRVIEPDDLLDDNEIAALGDAISAELLASVRARKWLDRAVKASPHLALMQVTFAIMVPRLQRHNILPGGQNDEQQTDAPVSMETGGTFGDSGGYGFGENHASADAIDALGIYNSTPV